MKDMTAEKLKSPLNLVPLSIEGGYFAEPYRSTEMISSQCLQGRYSGTRSVGSVLPRTWSPCAGDGGNGVRPEIIQFAMNLQYSVFANHFC